jgi:HEAT repeat protein
LYIPGVQAPLVAAAKRAHRLAVRKKDPTVEKLAHLRALAAAAPPSLVVDLRPFLQDKLGMVVAEAAKLAGEHGLFALVLPLGEAFARLTVDPVRCDSGCRGKIAVVEALRKLEAPEHDLYLRGVAYVQEEPSFGPPIDTAVPLRVSCAAALFETRHPFALLQATTLLADPEPNARSGAASVLGDVGGQGAEAVLRLKALVGDGEPDVTGACLAALLRADLPRSLPFVAAQMAGAAPAVTEQALVALGESRDERAVPHLVAYAEDPRAEVRGAALLGLSIARVASADDFLVGRVKEAPERAAREALGALKPRLYDEAFARRVREAVATRSAALRALFEESLPR